MTTATKPLEDLVQELPPHTHAQLREYIEYLRDKPEREASDPETGELGPEAEVSLREITAETVRKICNLSDTLTPPRKYMVAPNAISIAQAHFNEHAWFRAIYADDTLVGFLMLYDDPQEQEYFLWRLMIAGTHHGKGFGRRAIALLADYVRTRPGATVLETSCGQGPGSPEGFYRKLGFERNGKVLGEEVGLSLKLWGALMLWQTSEVAPSVSPVNRNVEDSCTSHGHPLHMSIAEGDTELSEFDPFGTLDQVMPGSVVLVGVPLDENSSFLRGAALAPSRIRETLCSGETNLCAEDGTDLGTEPRWLDLGDLDLGSGGIAFEQIEAAIASLLERGASVQSLGGDHAITYPIMRAYAAKYSDLTVLHMDAHPDLYDEFEGNRSSHACPFARIMEEELVTRLVQVGVRTMNPHQRAQAKRFGVEVVEMRQCQPGLELALDGPLYLSIDLDVLDPAFVPGVSHHEPGGFSVREVLRLVQELRVPVVGADIVELNPHRDPVGCTAMVAVKLLKEITSVMLRPAAASSPRS